MAALIPKSIRGRTVAITVALSAVAMALIVTVVALGMFRSLRQALLDTLEDRLDSAETAVLQGDFGRATDNAGSVLVVVLDSEGNVVSASSEEARRLDYKALVFGKDAHDFEIDDLPAAQDYDDEGDGLSRTGNPDGQGPSYGIADADDDPDEDDEEPDDDDFAGGYAPTGTGSTDSDDDDDYDDDDDDDDDGLGKFIGLALARAAQTHIAQASGTEAPVTDATLAEIAGGPGPFLVAQRRCSYHGSSYTIVAIDSIADAVASARRAAGILSVIFALMLAAIARFTWIMSGRTLQPVEEMRAATERIITQDLSARIPVPGHDPDLRPLAETFNEVIGRMEDDLLAQRRFISDASHELKSPVAASAMILDTLATHPDTISTDEAIADLRRENARMQSIVSDLLALARYDEGVSAADLTPCDLIDLVFERVAAIAAHSPKTFDTSGVEPVIARVDMRLMSHALSNLLDNAERFSASTVRVGLREEGDLVCFCVEDDGPGIAPEDRSRVFERFVRLNQTAKAAMGSTGIGLAVVKAVADTHGGRAYFTDSELGGARAVLEIPAG